MDITKTVVLPKGHYVVAVSGGVDSMVLLDVVRRIPGVSLTVAHFDHGIRSDSREDRKHVEAAARSHGLPFVYGEGALGPYATEDQARKARYAFLQSVKERTGARGIVTAHHLDDVIETAAHNILRGTGRKGMSSLKSVDGIVRPLLHLPKKHLITYAEQNNIRWREDSTNANVAYKRNYLRHVLLPKMQERSLEGYRKYKALVKRQADLNHAIDRMLQTFLHVQPAKNVLRRHDVIMLPHAVAVEFVGEWLRLNGKRSFTRQQLERLNTALRTAQPGTTYVLDKNHAVLFEAKTAKFAKQ